MKSGMTATYRNQKDAAEARDVADFSRSIFESVSLDQKGAAEARTRLLDQMSNNAEQRNQKDAAEASAVAAQWRVKADRLDRLAAEAEAMHSKDRTMTEETDENELLILSEAMAGGAAWERVLLSDQNLAARLQKMSPADRKLVTQAFCLGWHLSFCHSAFADLKSSPVPPGWIKP